MSKDPRGRLFHCSFQLYGKKDPEKTRRKVAYTFDAGPNACLFLLENEIPEVLALIKYFFPPDADSGFVKGIGIHSQGTLPESLLESISIEPSHGAVKYVISTKVGSGPCELGQEYSLLDEDGLPKS